jgi:hypothetical protein
MMSLHKCLLNHPSSSLIPALDSIPAAQFTEYPFASSCILCAKKKLPINLFKTFGKIPFSLSLSLSLPLPQAFEETKKQENFKDKVHP